MKNLLALITILLITSFSFAQEDEFQTIFKGSNSKTSISGFGAVTMDFGSINNEFGFQMGGEGAVLFNKSFFIGMYGKGLTTLPLYEFEQYSPLVGANVSYAKRAGFGHGGLLIGAIFQPQKPIHFGLSGKFGVGGVGLFDDYSNNYYDQDNDFTSFGPFYVFTPQADLEMNIASWFKIRASLGYQIVTSLEAKYQSLESGELVEKVLFNTSDFSTPTFSLGFVFGWFR